MADALTTVATYSQAMQARAARNFLEANGIRAFITDEFGAMLTWPNFIEAKVQVAAVDAERAKSLLATIDHA